MNFCQLSYEPPCISTYIYIHIRVCVCHKCSLIFIRSFQFVLQQYCLQRSLTTSGCRVSRRSKRKILFQLTSLVSLHIALSILPNRMRDDSRQLSMPAFPDDGSVSFIVRPPCTHIPHSLSPSLYLSLPFSFSLITYFITYLYISPIFLFV